MCKYGKRLFFIEKYFELSGIDTPSILIIEAILNVRNL